MTTTMANTSDDPVERLVGAIVGSADVHVVSLAHRILESQIGINSHRDANDAAQELSSDWRRVSRKTTAATTAEVQSLYHQLEHECDDFPEIPHRVLAVLTKFVGKRASIAAPPLSTSVSASSSFPPRPSTTTPVRAVPQSTPRVVSVRRTAVFDGGGGNNVVRTYHQSSPRFPPPSAAAAVADQRPSVGTSTMNDDQTFRTGPLSAERINMTATHGGDDGLHFQENDDNDYDGIDEDEWKEEEDALMHECLYSLQGIDGDRIRYFRRDPSDTRLYGIEYYEGIRVRSPAVSNRLLYTGRVDATRLGSGAMDALRICGEAGWLYSRIQSYIAQVQHDATKGVVARAFAEALAEQLHEYHSLLTTFEAKLPAWSLRQLLIELRRPTQRLKLLAMLTDGLKQYAGGRLLAGLHKHSLSGNTVHAALVQKLLHKACKPWFEILYMWTTQGVLSDPWNEFFIVEKANVEDKHLWFEMYTINHGQIVPAGILDEDLVGPSLNVGKGINFIRRCLQDGQWTMPSLRDVDGLETGHGSGVRPFDVDGSDKLGYDYRPVEDGNGENRSLKKTLDRSSSLVHSYILRTLKEDNHLTQHLFALKQFLLLGQGDFFSALMDGLHREFGQQASRNPQYLGGAAGINKQSLLAIVEGALRSTNAKRMPPYVLERLQIELLLAPEDEQSGPAWDWKKPESRQEEHMSQAINHRTVYEMFLLDYQAPDPMIAIVHNSALDRYKTIFLLLFRLKRIEFMLNYTWRQSASLQHSLQTQAQYTGMDVSSSEGYAQATFLLRNISILRQAMMHFIINLKTYLHFEVIEGGWQRLLTAIDDATTLDGIIEAHDRYLDDISRKAMVRDSGQGDPIQQELIDQVDRALTITSEFSLLQESLFNEALTATDLASERRKQAANRVQQGRWGFDSEREMEDQERFFGLSDPLLIEEVSRMTEAYNGSALELLRALNEKVNGGYDASSDDDVGQRHLVDLREEETDPQRFLIAQLDHNSYYSGQER